MRDYISIGSSPYDEPCAQVGQPDYRKNAVAECTRFIELLRDTVGPEPEGARLSIKWFPHDFGDYAEVVCYYETNMSASVDYALRCEAETPATWEEEPLGGTSPKLLYLWHPGTKDIFSGYGLAVAPAHLVGLVMIDRPKRADPAWLEKIHKTFGEYQLAAMTQTGERGIVSQMHIAGESLQYLRRFNHALVSALRTALLPLLTNQPAVILALRWDRAQSSWISTIRGGEA
jgi:hypothetical protein